MRFITEFDAVDEKWEYMNLVTHESLMGTQIASAFDYVKSGNNHRKLEIEAFPMDKWREFKSKLLEHFCVYPGSTTKMLDLIKELESFGKPVTTNNG
jgi:hypothetical protein